MRSVAVLACAAAALLAGCPADPFEGKARAYAGLSPRRMGADELRVSYEQDPQHYHLFRVYAKPPMVVIDRSTGGVDAAFHLLPEALRAARPEDVSSVVWVDYEKRLRGEGRTKSGEVGGRFFDLLARVTVIDVERDPPVTSYCDDYVGQEYTVLGHAPVADVGTAESEFVADKPAKAIAEWLARMVEDGAWAIPPVGTK